MKRLFLVRHAKSGSGDPLLNDMYRTLNQRGNENAVDMSNYIFEKYGCPDYFMSSPAIRAYSTALIFANEMSFNKDKIHLVSKLYESNIEKYAERLSIVEAKFETVILFAHNETISDFSRHLLKREIEEMPTCTVVILDFDIEKWNQIEQKTPELREYTFPEKL